MPAAITTQSITFENHRTARAVFPTADAKAEDIIGALDIKDHEAALLIIGGADSIDDSLRPPLTEMFSRGIARAAATVKAVIIDGGTRAGVMEMMGQGIADRGFKCSLVGVAPLELVSFPGSAGSGTTPLDPNHSHFVLVPGKAWGSETSVMFQLIRTITGGKLPAVALLVGGGATTRDEVLQAVRQNLSIIIVEGSGGFADELATAWKTRPDLSDPVMAEIIADGRMELHLLSKSFKGAERSVVRALGGDNVLTQAWQRFADYDNNALLQERRFAWMQGTILTIGLIATALALIKQVVRKGVDETDAWSFWWFIKYLLMTLPIVLTVLVAAANRFKQGNKWLLLRSGAESIKREIYRFRARAGDYKEVLGTPTATPGTPVPPTPEQVLAQRIEDVTRRVMQTEVNASSLRPYDKANGFPPYMYAIQGGDDGFTMLSPDRYVQVRLEDQLGYYRKKAVQYEKKLKWVHWAIYAIGGLGTLLGAINQQVWIALTTALAAALTTYITYKQTESTITKYNQAFTNLDNVKSWWTALPAEEQAKQENVDTLVNQTEEVLRSELDGWVQQMQNALAELRKDQAKAPEANDTSGTAAGQGAANQAAADQAAAAAAGQDGEGAGGTPAVPVPGGEGTVANTYGAESPGGDPAAGGE